jgi:uncharacterized membrane protein
MKKYSVLHKFVLVLAAVYLIAVLADGRHLSDQLGSTGSAALTLVGSILILLAFLPVIQTARTAAHDGRDSKGPTLSKFAWRYLALGAFYLVLGIVFVIAGFANHRTEFFVYGGAGCFGAISLFWTVFRQKQKRGPESSGSE